MDEMGSNLPTSSNIEIKHMVAIILYHKFIKIQIAAI